MSSIALTKALAKEFIETLGESSESSESSAALEEKVHGFVATAKRSEVMACAVYLRKAIDGRKVFDSVRRRLAIKNRAKQGPSSRASASKSKSAAPLEVFAQKALKAAHASKGKWHSNAYIYNAWTVMPGQMSLTEFKAKLVEAHRSDLLELGRADLVEAMSAEALRKSEIDIGHYRFHFIRLSP